MDMSQYGTESEVSRLRKEVTRLKKLTKAVRENKDILADVFLALNEDPPNASRAQESYEEMEFEAKCDSYLSPSAGGIWETWERHAVKTGELGPSYDVFKRRG